MRDSGLTQPIDVEVDPEVTAAYIRYLADTRVAKTIVFWNDELVSADLDEDGRVIGIEVLAFDEETIDQARALAGNHGLAFPDDLAKA